MTGTGTDSPFPLVSPREGMPFWRNPGTEKHKDRQRSPNTSRVATRRQSRRAMQKASRRRNR